MKIKIIISFLLFYNIMHCMESGALVSRDAFFKSVRNYEKMKKFLDQGTCSPNAVSSKGTHIFQQAVLHGSLECMQLLIERGTYVDAPSLIDESTVLHTAVVMMHVPKIKVLLESGVDVNAQTSLGYTPLHLSMFYCEPDFAPIAELLIKAGADVNARDCAGQTPLFSAFNFDLKRMNLLLRNHASPFFCDKWGKTVLHYAAQAGNMGAIELLAQHDGINLLQRDKKGRNALDIARKIDEDIYPDKGYIIHFFERLESANERDDKGQTALFRALEKGVLKMSLLLRNGADVDAIDTSGRKVIHYAVEKGKFDAIELLENYGGADIEHKDNDGNTALDLARLLDENKYPKKKEIINGLSYVKSFGDLKKH